MPRKVKNTPKVRGTPIATQFGRSVAVAAAKQLNMNPTSANPANPANPAVTTPKPGRPKKVHPSSHKGASVGTGWTWKNMMKAWELVQSGMSIRVAAAKAGVPRTTFQDRLQLLKKKQAEGVTDFRPYCGHASGGKAKPRLFSEEEEQELVDYVFKHADQGFGLCSPEFRSITHHWGFLNGNQVVGQGEDGGGDGVMSWKWQKRFLDRHPECKMNIPLEMSLYRAKAPDKNLVSAWFDFYKENLEALGIDSPRQVWNCDETGFINQPKSQKTLGRSEGISLQVVAGERGQLTTVLSFSNAEGEISQPFVILKGKKVQPKWFEFVPKGWQVRVSKNGWINKAIFTEAGQFFLQHLKDLGLFGLPHLLLLDGHPSHKFNYGFNLLMKTNQVECMLLPAHTSHFLQPYDGAFLATCKKNWQKIQITHNRLRRATSLSKIQFFLLFRKCWRLSAQPHILQASFRMTGIWPVDFQRVDQQWFRTREALGRVSSPHPPPHCFFWVFF